MPFFQNRGVKINFRWSGNRGSPVLVLAHSLGASEAMWYRQEKALGERFHVLLYDQRGHGQSFVPPGPYIIEEFVEDLLGLLDYLLLPQVHFCGLSLGGMIGLSLAQCAPERLARLVISNTAAKIEDPTLLRARIESIKSDGLASIADNVLERWFSETYRAAHPDIIQIARKMFLATCPEAYVSSIHAVCELDLRAKLNAILVPTLVITGDADQATPASWGEAIAASIPNACHVTLQAAHLANIEASEDFNREMIKFIV